MKYRQRSRDTVQCPPFWSNLLNQTDREVGPTKCSVAFTRETILTYFRILKSFFLASPARLDNNLISSPSHFVKEFEISSI